MVQFVATVSASDPAEAVAKVAKRLPEGWTTGEAQVRSQKHLLQDVIVQGEGDRNALWVGLTSYGISPSDDLGSFWQTVEGVGR